MFRIMTSDVSQDLRCCVSFSVCEVRVDSLILPAQINQLMHLYGCCLFRMVFACSRVWRRPVCARYVSLSKSRACRASPPTTSPPRLRRWSPGMPGTMESATCSRPAAGTPGMITQQTEGDAVCCRSASAPLIYLLRWFAVLWLFSLIFIPLQASPLTPCSIHSSAPLLLSSFTVSLLFLLLWTPLAFLFQSRRSALFSAVCSSSRLSSSILLSRFSSFSSQLICPSFLTGFGSSCFCSSLFSIPLCFVFFCLGVYVNSFIGHGCGFVFLSFPQHADVRDAREEGALWCNRSGSLR